MNKMHLLFIKMQIQFSFFNSNIRINISNTSLSEYDSKSSFKTFRVQILFYINGNAIEKSIKCDFKAIFSNFKVKNLRSFPEI